MDPASIRAMLASAPPESAADPAASLSALLKMIEHQPPGARDAVMQHMLRAARSGAGPTSSQVVSCPSGATDDRTAYLDVLRQCCSPVVVAEYERLPSAAQKDLLTALKVTVEETATYESIQELECATASGRESIPGPVDQHSEPNTTCAVTTALRLHQPLTATAGTVQLIRRSILPTWGTTTPKLIQLMRHEASYRHYLKELQSHSDMFQLRQTNSTLVRPEGRDQGCRDWAALRPVGVASLRLFGVAAGRVLAGTLVGGPIVTVGITTLLEDPDGDVVQLGLYNQLPGGVASQDLAERLFPEGARLRIAEPFLKIFRDGHRGVRVDSPADIHVDPGSDDEDLRAAKQRGNALARASNFAAAAEEYWRGLRGGGASVALLLSNRAQAQLKRRAWPGALRDSAAALLIAPEEAKAWARYCATLAGLGHAPLAARARCISTGTGRAGSPGRPAVRAALDAALAAAVPQPPQECSGSATGLKARGNAAYNAGDFAGAEALYSAALAVLPATAEAAAALRNVALCGLRTGALHDALAAAAASLRLEPSAKARHRAATALALLGEFVLADEVLRAASESCGAGCGPGHLEHCASLRRSLADAQRRVEAGYAKPTLVELLRTGPGRESVVGEWLAEGRIGTALIEGKGRGVRALCRIEAGEALVVQRPRVSVSADAVSSGELLTSMDSDSRLMDDASNVKLKAQLTSAASVDGLLATTVSLLHDGSAQVKPLTDLDEFLHRLSGAVLPGLLQQPRFLPVAERLELGYARVSRVVDINCHGDSMEDAEAFARGAWEGREGREGREARFCAKLKGGSTSLYPAVSMINHASAPNCLVLPITQDGAEMAVAIVARQPLPPGAELTVSYSDDAKVLKSKWGIDA